MKKILGLFVLLLTMVALNAQSSVTISWSPVAEYEDGTVIAPTTVVKYNVWRATQANLSDIVKLNTTDLTATSYTDASIQSKAKYYYVCTAYVFANNESAQSNAAMVNTNPPKGPVIQVTVQ